MKKYAEQMQFLRFIAFFFIFVLHSFSSLEPWFYTTSAAYCMVAFFFALSGFGSGYSSAGAQQKVTIGNVIRHEWTKIKKVYPLFFATTVFAFLITGLPQAINAGDTQTVINYLKILTKVLLFLQSWSNPFLYFNGVTWFLSTVMFLYLLDLPLRCFLDRLHGCKKEPLLLILLIIACFASSVIISVLAGGRSDISYILYAFPPSRIFEYTAGMAMGRLTVRMTQSKPVKGTSVIFTAAEIAALVIWVIGFFFPAPSTVLQIQVMWLIPNFFILLIFGMGQGRISALFRLKPFVFLGNISMECYLVHQLVVVTYQHFISMENTICGTLFFFCFNFGFTILISALLHRSSKQH